MGVPVSGDEKTRRKGVLLYPWLIGLYPVAALLGQNVDQVGLSAGFRPLLLSLLLVAVGVILGRLLLRNWAKAAAVTSLGFILFFSYGHVYGYVEQINATGLVIGRHRFLLPLWAGLFILGTWRLARSRGVGGWTSSLNLVAGIALVLPAAQIASYYVRYGVREGQARASASTECALSLPEGRDPPDVYYIILDGYMRDDILREVTGFDNSPFLDALSELGFVVARRSQSNYPWTDMSLASSLNLNYLDSLGWQEPGRDWTLGRSLIVHSYLRRELECLGYSAIAFETAYWFTEWTDADYYLAPYADSRDRIGVASSVSEFEWMWIDTSLALALEDAEQAFTRWFPVDFHELGQDKRERVLFALEQMPVIASGPGRKLVFVHIGSPHSPFVFGPRGEHVFFTGVGGAPSESRTGEIHPYWRAYADEVAYVNGRLVETLSQIIARSSTPPIIVIQGDHGWVDSPPEAHMPILNAYFLPGGGRDVIYDEISPVNTFRVILTSYFEAEFGLLEDVSYCAVPGLSEIDPDPCIWTSSRGPVE